jgi:hypothetical protein
MAFSFRSVSFRSVSFRSVSFRSVSFRSVSFRTASYLVVFYISVVHLLGFAKSNVMCFGSTLWQRPQASDPPQTPYMDSLWIVRPPAKLGLAGPFPWRWRAKSGSWACEASC